MDPAGQAFAGPSHQSWLAGMPASTPESPATAQSLHPHIRVSMLCKINLRSFKILFLMEL